MDFQINVEVFRQFLNKCMLSGLIKDLYLRSFNGVLYAKFTNSSSNLYCEVYEKNLKITEEGQIRIAKLDQVLSVLSRIESELIRVKSTENLYVITDGSSVGKMKVDLVPAGGADLLESYERIKPYDENPDVKFFDKDELKYNGGKIEYKVGYEVPLSALGIILKDAKAFKLEVYKFFVKNKILNCSIEDQTVGQSLNRKMQTIQTIGEGEIPTVMVGSGFREMVQAIEKESERKNVKILFAEESILITDGSQFFYNLHTIIED